MSQKPQLMPSLTRPEISEPSSLKSIFTSKGTIIPEVLKLPWPETVPILGYDQNIADEWGNYDEDYPNNIEEWVASALRPVFKGNMTDKERLYYHQMKQIVMSLIFSIDRYRYNTLFRIEMRIVNIDEDWNYTVRSIYNIAWAFLGYTENQYPFINDAVKILIKLGITNNYVHAYKISNRYHLIEAR